MEWLHPLPQVTSLLPAVVALLKRRIWPALIGFVIFETGYVAILLHEDRGANSPRHYIWLAGLLILTLGITPRAAPGSWWDLRYRSTGRKPEIAAATPTAALILVFILPFLYPLYYEQGGPPESVQIAQSRMLVGLLALALIAPVVGAVVAAVTRNPKWRSSAILAGAIGITLASVVVAYTAGAFVFGF
jgi:hypothetical protein